MRRALLNALAATMIATGSRVVAQGQGAPGGAAQRRGLPSIAERTEGFQRQDGFFPLHWDDATGTLYLEIPRLNQEVLWVSGLSAGMGRMTSASTALNSAARSSCGSSASARGY